MTDGPLMDADCIHGNPWYECEICWEELNRILYETENYESGTEYEG